MQAASAEKRRRVRGSPLIQASFAAAAAARDSLRTADLHHCFVQDLRKQAEAEYKAAFDAESKAAADMDRERRHAEDMTEGHKRLRSDAFRSLVKAKGGATCVLRGTVVPCHSHHLQPGRRL